MRRNKYSRRSRLQDNIQLVRASVVEKVQLCISRQIGLSVFMKKCNSKSHWIIE